MMKKALFNLPVMTAALLSVAATVVISALVFAHKPEPPTKLLNEPMVLPDFAVTDHHGQSLTRQGMAGRVWVCDFFLTRCTYVCPRLSMTMAELAEALGEDPALDEVRLVSFSVDPEHDTLEALGKYRRDNAPFWADGREARREAIDQRWVHARAEDQALFWQWVKDGFKMHVGPSEGDPTTPVAHGSKLVLIDRRGRIRGYYEGMTPEDLPTLVADIRRLVEESD